MDNTMDNNIIDKLPKKNLDIQQIIDKIKNLPIDDKDKAAILEQMKNNIINPSKGENKSLDDIQDKYSSINMPRSENDHNFNLKPISNNQSQNNQGYNNQANPNKYQFMDQSQPMTVAHFEILKNKLDSLQYELIDLLRHVKDYTQRYMNAIRQQDLDKINEYITGLFEVDKTLKETQALADEDIDAEEEEKEEEPQDRKSVISRATSGIKNLFGSIGDNVAGITNLVSNTTKIANDYLVKKVIPTSNASNVNVTKTGNTNTIVKNKNIVSIEDYISDMNKMESMNKSLNESKENTSIPNSNIITTSSNNINSLGSIKPPTNQNTQETTPVTIPTTTPASEPEDESEKLEGALKKLNDEMNKDIDKTVNNSNQNGGKRTHKNNSNKINIKISKKENNLTNKIKLLKLKLTKNKLQKQLSESKNNKITNNMTKKNKKK